HTNLGIKCTGGRVNGKAVRINEPLKTGDVVDIMSGKNQKPSPDWLNFVVTTKARNKIRQKLSEAEFQTAADGKELLGRRLKN
ncbi:TGS domain-containing protein, partial [Acinetobacter baumannii]